MDLGEDRIESKNLEEEKVIETSNKIIPSECCSTDPDVDVFGPSFENLGFPETTKDIIDETVLVEKEEFSINSSQSLPCDLKESIPVVRKGTGLRKWRRIKRDLKKDGISSIDSAQILKRRLHNTEASKEEEENKMKSKVEAEDEGEDSVTSVESRNACINSLPVGSGILELELERLASGGFSIGMDSDNSEDHSSKSSTATSAPRLRNEVLASGKERGRMKISGGKGSTRLGLQKVQLSRGTIDPSKKSRGDLARFEKENSLSSVESDLRSSSVGVVQWGSGIGINGKHGERSMNFDEHSDDAHTGEEVRSVYYKENGKAENLSRKDLEDELLGENSRKRENFKSSSDLDPFLESMGFLQDAQNALEKEIEKIAAIGKEHDDDNDRQFEGMVPYNSQLLKGYLVDLTKKAENLESTLEEASMVIETKEQKLRELEALLSLAQLPKLKGSSTHILPIQPHEEELNSELEILLKEKMEAEIEYLIISRSMQNLKILSEDHIALLEEQSCLASDQKQMMLKLRDAEHKIITLSEQKDKLEAYCMDLAGTENVMTLQNNVCKFSLCVIVQLMFLSIAFGLFLMQLFSPIDGVVPT